MFGFPRIRYAVPNFTPRGSDRLRPGIGVRTFRNLGEQGADEALGLVSLLSTHVRRAGPDGGGRSDWQSPPRWRDGTFGSHPAPVPATLAPPTRAVPK